MLVIEIHTPKAGHARVCCAKQLIHGSLNRGLLHYYLKQAQPLVASSSGTSLALPQVAVDPNHDVLLIRHVLQM